MTQKTVNTETCGIYYGAEIVLTDEPAPDSKRFWYKVMRGLITSSSRQLCEGNGAAG